MTWKIRHQGSPRSIEGLGMPQVVEGLQDGLWEPTDEVMGPQDRQWVAIESHPQLAEVAADIEPPPPREQEDEARLDMNPLIDVALVLLIFFILTTSYAAIQKMINMPAISEESTNNPKHLKQVNIEQLRPVTIMVAAKMENGKSVVYVEDNPEPIKEDELVGVLKGYMTHDKNKLLIDAQDQVDWGTVVSIQDAAHTANFQQVLLQVHPKGEQTKK